MSKRELDVITIGDGMITMNPKAKGPMRFVQEFERKIGGAELNFALGCARLGLEAGWISRLGNDEFGKHIYNTMRGEGVNVSQVELVDGYPTSLNFKEIMEDGSGRTFYYRKSSPTSTMTPDSIDPEFIKQAKILHVSGVFPSIDPQNVEIIRRAIEVAKENEVLVSFDPNIRLKMWSKDRAREVLRSFLPYVDIILTGQDEAEILIGVSDTKSIIKTFQEEFNIQYIAIKNGAEGAVGAKGSEVIELPAFPPRKVVDTVGAGDGFDAGFIYGVTQGWTLEKILTFANMVGSMVVSVMGDNEGLPYYEEVLAQLGEREIIDR
ncbi:sugar kinase [Bacillus horti]|uniref:2-dehydro-3-deoxygluconokinase n=1 Tax=Caldalkalibacillus horti TaxID=77523 RepID=A0ABT9W3U5_9BACI|nr:sugar kinase [Bacillus horti]MDQ0167520.1 2-dehydro-3-deoxygluconokinase [Bacillus horti]